MAAFTIHVFGDPRRFEKIKFFAENKHPRLDIVFIETYPADGDCLVRVFPASLLSRLWRDVKVYVSKPFDICYGEAADMDLAFLCGCVDYLAEPWSEEEFFSRVVRCIDKPAIDFFWGRVAITPFALTSGRVSLALSREEYLLLRSFSRNPNVPIPRACLYRCLERSEDGSRVVDVHISSLRKKLRLCASAYGVSPAGWNPFRSVRGLGYGLSNLV